MFLIVDCKEYSFLVKEDVQILHGDKFGGQLAFYKLMFENGCYGICKLKYLKIQISLSKTCFLFISFIKNLISFSDVFHYHNNIVDKAQMVTGFVFDKTIDASPFILMFAYAGVHCSHSTAFDSVKNEVI